MKIQYCSDLHLEFRENERFLREHPIIPVGDILILAGDVVPFPYVNEFPHFFDKVKSDFKEVYWIPGNHEYYHDDAVHRSAAFFEKIRDNIFLLNNQVQISGGTRFVFSTLWTHISALHQMEIQKRMNDFRVIGYGDKRLSTIQYNKFHQEAKRFLTGTLKQPFDGKTVVVTHHVPTMQHYPEQYKGDALNEAFASELSSFIETSEVDYWIYGHHHCNVEDFRIGKTQMLTNQLGYVSNGEQVGFRRDACFEV
jgi:predicted phosphohydrolase